jgi:ABC-type transport system involved in multi-copper enzyme maturation permease subunit
MTPILMRPAAGVVLVLVQFLAALPWLMLIDPVFWRSRLRRPAFLGIALGVIAASGLFLSVLLYLVQDRDTIVGFGRFWGSVLHVQVVIDLFVGLFALLLWIWPKGAAVALAAFKEGIRQPLFWVLAILAPLFLFFFVFIPYFTFGEEYKMYQELGYDLIMVVTLIFATLAASTSISDEIEGRTAVTLMSKPVSRREFLLGKYVGLLLAALAMTFLLGWFFDWFLLLKRTWENATYENLPSTVPAAPVRAMVDFLRPSGEMAHGWLGFLLWSSDALESLPGLVLGFCKVMVVLAIAVSLATRVPMVVNLVSCLVIYLLGHLMPVLVQIGRHRNILDPNSAVGQMLYFMAQLFEVLLPGMDFFGVGTMLATDTSVASPAYLLYVGSVVLYGLLYTAIVLLFGLILFEDRDLA